MKGNILRSILLCAVLALCTVVCAGCGSAGNGDAPDLEQYFSKEEMASWEKEAKENKYTMNGGYYISFQGQLYPVEFENAAIHWLTETPDDLIFVEMRDLYTDASLKKRCAYIGRYKELVLFQGNEYYDGYILDGARPAYGSVLYMDETDQREMYVGAYQGYSYGADDELGLWWDYDGQIIYREKSIAFKNAYYILTDEYGVFYDTFSTIRKIIAFARENNIPFDAYAEYTGVPYPSSIMKLLDDIWEETDPIDGKLDVITVEHENEIKFVLSFGREEYPDICCTVLTTPQEIESFYRLVRYGRKYWDVIQNEYGMMSQCYDSTFFGKNSGATTKIFHSIEAFNRYLEELKIVDEDRGVSLSWFSNTENGDKTDGWLDYLGSDVKTMYAVWQPYHTVNLHAENQTMQTMVHNGRETVLQVAMRPNYAFEGWYATADFSGQPITKLTYADSYTDLYAKFREVDHYTLTFEYADGIAPEPIEYVYGDEFTLPIVTKAFHIFKGWCTDPEGSGDVYTQISGDVYGSYHLYPCFEPRTYTITFCFKEQTVVVPFYYGEHYTLFAEGVGDTFLGYFDENGVQYTDEYGNSLVPFTDGADIQLFAKYKEN